MRPCRKGFRGGGANLRRLCLALHAQGQVTTERLTAILNGIGMDISKRQVVRILTSDLDGFVAEDQAILRSGLATAPDISVEDTGARHLRRDEVTTQIGGSRFSVFRRGRSKARLNVLSPLRAGCEDHVINVAALDDMRHRKVAPDVIGKLAAHPETSFASQMVWCDHLVRMRLDVFDRTGVRDQRGGRLEQPEIPLHTNASENDLRTCVTRRRISGGTMSADSPEARDVLLGPMKTCRTLGISFFADLGDRPGVNGTAERIPPLPDLVSAQPA